MIPQRMYYERFMQGTADVTFIYKLKVEREEENQD